MGSCESKISPEASNGAKVVIVGGGYGGVALALALRRRGINFVLIDAKEFFHHNVGALRSAVYPGCAILCSGYVHLSLGVSLCRGCQLEGRIADSTLESPRVHQLFRARRKCFRVSSNIFKFDFCISLREILHFGLPFLFDTDVTSFQ